MNKKDIFLMAIVTVLLVTAGFFMYIDNKPILSPVSADGPGGTTDYLLGDPCTTHVDCGAHQLNGNGLWVFGSCLRCSATTNTCIGAGANSLCNPNVNGVRCSGTVLETTSKDYVCDNENSCSVEVNLQVTSSTDCSTTPIPTGVDTQCNYRYCYDDSPSCQTGSYGDETSCTLPSGGTGVCVMDTGINSTSTCQ